MSNFYNNGVTLSGDPSPYSLTTPAELDFRNKFKSYSQGIMGQTNKQLKRLYNPIPGIATPEQTKATMEAFGKTADSAGLNKASGFKGFLGKSGIGNSAISAGVGAATNIIKGITPQAEDKGSQVAGQVADTAGDIAMMFPGIGTAIGAGLKGLSALITSVGPHVKGNTAKELTDRSSSYGGLGKLDSKKFGLMGIGAGKRYRKKVQEREQFRGLSEGILANANLNKDATAGAIQNMANKYNLEKMGGWQQTNGIRFGKTGMKYDLTFAHNVMNLIPSKDDISKFKEGGKMNVIPDGALHARKHNIEDSSLDGKITKKGIPVMHEEGGELTQVAEIEKNEIIFTKEVTEKLEELRDKGTEEAAIEAGKLLVQEILYNTQDNTGLLKLIG